MQLTKSFAKSDATDHSTGFMELAAGYRVRFGEHRSSRIKEIDLSTVGIDDCNTPTFTHIIE
ncbi:hypothetical protein FHW16_005820 [Phyllobacterium myrsinacearum]|uniref:Uncharacterized protein n=1 Tax=Phyllobacterium myrsinacearum TaxID=28101 RepID=A0A839ETG9_9HYPH|nr:hypothetical protein [Phyllobacterium myrsinacearum]